MKMNRPNKSNKDIWLVYDGECPACRNFCKYVRIRESVGKLHLVDARESSPLVEQIKHQGLNLDEGMVVKMGDKFYHGSDAMHILSLLSTRSDFFNRLCYHTFKNQRASRILYPMLKFARNLLLKIKGTSKINNLDH